MLPEECDHRVTELRERDVEPPRLVALLHVASALAARADPDHVHRAVTHAVIAVSREILGRELPVTGDEPLVDAADRLGSALAPIPGVEQEIEIELVAAQVFGEARSGGVPRRPDRALVVLHPRDFDQPPLAPVEQRAVRILRERHADERPVGAVAPAVVRTLELDRVALVVAAHLHAAVPARVEKDADPPRAVAAQDDGFLAHRRVEIVTRLRDLALVPDEEPGTGKDPLELLPVDLVADENLPADDPVLDVDQAFQGSRLRTGHAGPPRVSSVATARRSDRRRVMVGQDAPPR